MSNDDSNPFDSGAGVRRLSRAAARGLGLGLASDAEDAVPARALDVDVEQVEEPADRVVHEVVAAGASRIAVVRAIRDAGDPEFIARTLRSALPS